MATTPTVVFGMKNQALVYDIKLQLSNGVQKDPWNTATPSIATQNCWKLTPSIQTCRICDDLLWTVHNERKLTIFSTGTSWIDFKLGYTLRRDSRMCTRLSARPKRGSLLLCWDENDYMLYDELLQVRNGEMLGKWKLDDKKYRILLVWTTFDMKATTVWTWNCRNSVFLQKCTITKTSNYWSSTCLEITAFNWAYSIWDDSNLQRKTGWRRPKFAPTQQMLFETSENQTNFTLLTMTAYCGCVRVRNQQ